MRLGIHLVAALILAQGAVSDQERSAVVRAIERRVAECYEAIKTKNVERLLDFYAHTDEFVVAADGELTVGYSTWEPQLRQIVQGIASVDQIERRNQHVYVLAPDAASYTSEFHWTITTTAGKTVSRKGSWTYVFKKLSGEWKIVHSTGTHLPVAESPASARR